VARLGFLIGYKGQDPSEIPKDIAKENLLGVFTCKQSVAIFLGMEALAYVPSGAKRTRAGYVKSVMKSVNGAAPAYTDVTVEAGEIDYAPDSSPRAKTVILKTGLKAKKTYRTLSLTFPSNATVAVIGDALASYIAAGKIQVTSGSPSATEIFPQYTIKGGKTYPLMTKAAAIASTAATAPATKAEQDALIALAK
jgi:hypothetical protein